VPQPPRQPTTIGAATGPDRRRNIGGSRHRQPISSPVDAIAPAQARRRVVNALIWSLWSVLGIFAGVKLIERPGGQPSPAAAQKISIHKS
jgi:hypothetical protein